MLTQWISCGALQVSDSVSQMKSKNDPIGSLRTPGVVKCAVATPVVWEDDVGFVTALTRNIGRQVAEVNEMAERYGEPFTVARAFVDVHSLSRKALPKMPPHVAMHATARTRFKRDQKGMAFWWYKSVSESLKSAPSAGLVVYFPPDVEWKRSKDNTVIESNRMFGMLKAFVQHRADGFLIGQYISTSREKEETEHHVVESVRRKYPLLPGKITRPRSEFWATTPTIFRAFQAACAHKDLSKVSDPSLLLLVYCLDSGTPVWTFDLGKYQVDATPDPVRAKRQRERAERLLETFAGQFVQSGK